MNTQTYDAIILGAGAAGMMCAIQAAKRGRRVILLEHAKKVGTKILISGGGRCNFTNTGTSPEAFVSQNPHFCKSALSRFTPFDFIGMVKSHEIAFHEKKLGQLFCDVSARSIVSLLVAECERAGAAFSLETKIYSMAKEGTLFKVDTSRGSFHAPSVVVATGGLSIPQIGATGFGYDIARQFGLKVVSPAPALDGFVLDDSSLKELAGISLDVLITCRDVSFRENILFTHFGLSGPASLQASLYWDPGDEVTINLFPDKNIFEWLREKKRQGSKAEIKNLLAEWMPKRSAEYFSKNFLPSPASPSSPLNQIADKILQNFCGHLQNWKIIPKRTVGYHKAEVTRGGVSTDELSSQTMESKKVPGLYFIGEVVDVTGWLGGYNFQWAWASGWVAGMSLS